MIIRARAPLRLAFSGSGTDCPPWSVEQGSRVVGACINKFASVSLYERRNAAGQPVPGVAVDAWPYGVVGHRLVSTRAVTEEQVKGREALRAETSLLLLKACLNLYGLDESAPFLVSMNVESALGTGLGASSSLTVALLRALDEYHRARREGPGPLASLEAEIRAEVRGSGAEAAFERPPSAAYNVALAKLAWEVERKALGQAGGWQDHVFAVLGGAHALSAGPGAEFPWPNGAVLPWWDDVTIAELEECSLLAYAGRRERDGYVEALQGGMGAAQQAMKDATRIAGEMERDVRRGDLRRFGIQLYDAWQAKLRVAPVIASGQVHTVIREALRSGAIGAQLMGAGGGGFVYIHTSPDLRNRIIAALAQVKSQCLPFTFERRGVHAWTVED